MKNKENTTAKKDVGWKFLYAHNNKYQNKLK